jgi:hypothetical protein
MPHGGHVTITGPARFALIRGEWGLPEFNHGHAVGANAMRNIGFHQI